MAGPNGRDDLKFPLDEAFHDCCGRERRFRIDCLAHEGGYFLRARESTKDGAGYEFAAHSGTAAYLALAALRATIRRGLSIRYLAGEGEPIGFSHGTARGYIGDGGVVIDGRLVAFDDLARLLQEHEGWQLWLRVADPYEDL